MRSMSSAATVQKEIEQAAGEPEHSGRCDSPDPDPVSVFGEAGWAGIFGPVFVLGAVLVLVRSFLNQATDRWLTAGYVVMVTVYVAACQFAVSDAWSVLAGAVLNE
jgi:hypothetical protein